MRSRSIRITPIHALVAFALLALLAVAVSAAAPEPAEGNMPKPAVGAIAPAFSLVDQNGKWKLNSMPYNFWNYNWYQEPFKP